MSTQTQSQTQTHMAHTNTDTFYACRKTKGSARTYDAG